MLPRTDPIIDKHLHKDIRTDPIEDKNPHKDFSTDPLVDKKLFKDLHTRGNSIIMVTHEDDVAHEAERIIRIRDGLVHT